MPDPRPRPSDAVRSANRSAAQSFGAKPADVPCETCGSATPATELDGALMGRDCTPMTNQRAQGRIKARTVTERADIVTHRGTIPRTVQRPIEAVPPRQGLSGTEIQRAAANGYRSESACCQRKRRESGERTIVYVNGIRNTPSDHCTTLAHIANLTCARVVGVYNATEGGGADLAQVTTDRALINAAAAGRPVQVGDRRNPAVDSTRDLIVQTQRDPSLLNQQPLELMAHSQGGAITSLSLFSARATLNDAGADSSLSNVSVTSLNSAAPRWPSGPKYEHFAHAGDFVAMSTGVGSELGDASRVGPGATTVLFSNAPIWRDERFVWREVRHDGRPERRSGTPMGAGIDPISFHGADAVVLPMYAQRIHQTGGTTCETTGPRVAQPPATPR